MPECLEKKVIPTLVSGHFTCVSLASGLVRYR
jgi:hypothetical protein